MLATSAQLARLPSGGEVAVAGLVIARQRPGTANGTMFLLFEDEFGTINLIVPKAVYDATASSPAPSRCCWPGAGWSARRSARSSRLGRAREGDAGREEQGAAQEQIRPVINVLVRELAPLERFVARRHRR